MTFSPIEEAQGRRIGSVEFVSPNEIKVALDLDAPDNTALNAGSPRPFPRINSYLMIPSEEGFVVGQVEWIVVEGSQFPKRRGFLDFGLVDLPFPQRRLSLNPVGTLVERDSKEASKAGEVSSDTHFILRRGVYSFPSVGDPVVLPTNSQLRDIVESGENRHILIGHAPLAGNAEVRVDPDRLFGRHLAVLGNTGSGKSCTVAGLIQWSLEETKKTNQNPNARFIILDPNGEYTKLFQGKDQYFTARIFKGDDPVSQLKVPLWFWNSDEWSSFVQASGRAQRPLLRKALREVRFGRDPLSDDASEDSKRLILRRYLSSQLISMRKDLRSNAIKTDATKFGFLLKAIENDLVKREKDFPLMEERIRAVIEKIKIVLAASYNTFEKGGKTIEYYHAFQEAQVEEIIQALHEALSPLGGLVYEEGPGENTPIPFEGVAFADHLELLAEQEDVSQFIDTLIIRIRTMLADSQMRKIVSESLSCHLETWLENYIGSSNASNGPVTVIDLSLVPSEIIHIVTAVIARMVLEALQRYRRMHPEGKALPTILIMEEAHTFIRRYREDAEETSAASTCCRVFERIAREGRKFGLGLVLSSQRPSELSPTVLSQCNSFLLHRISNDRDQETVSKLLPDHLRSVLRELPVLPTRYAFLLGWATELPVLTEIRELPIEQQPQSQDPDFWAVWTGKDKKGNAVRREVDWKAIADDWQEIPNKSGSDPQE